MIPDLREKFEPCTIYGFLVTGIETEEEEEEQQQEELQRRNFSYVPHANFILGKHVSQTYIHSYPVVVKDVDSH